MAYGSLGNRCLTGVTWATRKRAVISKSLLSAAALRYYFISERTITNRVWTPHIRANIFDVENVVSDQKEEEDQLPQNLDADVAAASKTMQMQQMQQTVQWLQAR